MPMRGHVTSRTANCVRRRVTPDGFRLGTWLNYQRAKRGRGELEEEKIARLDAIGMVW